MTRPMLVHEVRLFRYRLGYIAMPNHGRDVGIQTFQTKDMSHQSSTPLRSKKFRVVESEFVGGVWIPPILADW